MNIYFICIGDRPHAKYMALSFKKRMPNHRLIQFSDYKSPMVEGVDEQIKSYYDGHLMLFMMDCYRFCEPPFMTVADDCIIDSSLEHLMTSDFDVALVKRGVEGNISSKQMEDFPWTNGLVVVNHKEFYQDCYDTLYSMKEQSYEGKPMWDWWGDMACINKVIGSGKYNVKLLSEGKYCRKPKWSGDGNRQEAVMYHYSADRKHMMQHHGTKQTR